MSENDKLQQVLRFVEKMGWEFIVFVCWTLSCAGVVVATLMALLAVRKLWVSFFICDLRIATAFF